MYAMATRTPTMSPLTHLAALFAAASLPALAEAAVVVTAPNGASPRVAAGTDFATEVVGNAWDMDRTRDVQLAESTDLVNQLVSGGTYVATTGNTDGNPVIDPSFFMLFQGIQRSVPNATGDLYPIATSRFRYLTFKARVSGGGASGNQLAMAFWYRDRDSIPDRTFGCSAFIPIPVGGWQIVTVDLTVGAQSAGCGSLGNQQWTDSALQRGFRIDPVIFPGDGSGSGVNVEIDWIRLTSPTVTASQRFTVTWTDNVSNQPYTVTAIDADGARFVLGANVAGNARSFDADVSRLAPGNYTIEVSNASSSDTGSAPLVVNRPPEIVIESPSVSGDQARNYALVERGASWGPMDATDVRVTSNLANVSYSNPPGTLTARPTTNDPAIVFDTGIPTNQTTGGNPIDASLYRSLCYVAQVQGPRDIGAGSVARILYGNGLASLSTTLDIIVEEGLNETCFRDVASLPLEPGSPSAWAGLVNFIRFDPHEFPVAPACTSNPTPTNCRDVRLDAFVLSPYFRANPAFLFDWQIADADSSGQTVRIFLDPDRTPQSGNERQVVNVASSTGPDDFTWTAAAPVTPGTYEVYFEVSDGTNTVTQYAGGPLVVQSVVDPAFIFGNGFE